MRKFDFHHILIRANNWIGDVVMISPAIRSLRKAFPDAEIAILAKPWVLDALRGSPLFDRLLAYERPGRHAGATGFARMARELRRERFDAAVLFQNALEAALLSALARIPVRVGFATDGRGPLLTHPFPLPPDGAVRHRGEEFLDLVEFLGCARDGAPPEFPEPAPAGPPSPGVHPARVALHPGASKPARAWPAERFGRLGSELQRRFGAELLLLGGPEEERLIATIAGLLAAPPLALPPPPSVGRMAAWLRTCRLFIGNDSGPMHVAAALGVPVVALFGPGHPGRSGPFRPRAGFLAVTGRFPCSPCRQAFFRECDPAPTGKPPCLEVIPVEEVLTAASRFLDPRQDAARARL